MPNLLYWMIADRLIVDLGTNRVTAVDVLEELTPPRLPVRYPGAVHVLTVWGRTPDENQNATFTWRLVEKVGDDIRAMFDGMDIELDSIRNRALLLLNGFELPAESGPMNFQVQWRRRPDDAWIDIGSPWVLWINAPIAIDPQNLLQG